MTTYEFEGKTAEEAIENASRELNHPVEDLDVDIIEPGSPGIFGLVAIINSFTPPARTLSTSCFIVKSSGSIPSSGAI